MNSLLLPIPKRGAGSAVLLAMWLIDASNAKNERKTSIQSIAVDASTGTRIPSFESQIEDTFRTPQGHPALHIVNMFQY